MYAKPAYTPPQPDQDPDGNYWKDGTKIKAEQFISLTGREEYDRWCDIVLPGNTGVQQTWKLTYWQIAGAVGLLWQGRSDMTDMVKAAELAKQAYEWGLEPIDLADYRDLLIIADEEMRK
jgi:hypothetical protein